MAIPTEFLLPLNFYCPHFPISHGAFVCRGIQKNVLKVVDFEDIGLDLLISSAVRTGL